MPKILIVDHQPSVRKSLIRSLGSSGYEVNETPNGIAAIKIVSKNRYDLMLLDVDLPGTDGFQVLSNLKENPLTSALPVIMLTSIPDPQVEASSLRLGASNVLTKPCDKSSLERLVRIALREGEDAVKAQIHTSGLPGLADMEPLAYDDSEEPDALAKYSGQPSNLINTGGTLTRLDTALGEGLLVGGLALIEGPSKSGKSVVCQYILHGAVSDGWDAALFTSDPSAGDLSQQMSSIGLDLPSGVHGDRLSVYPLTKPARGESSDSSIVKLVSGIENLPESCGLVVIDGISEIAFASEPREVMGFFSTFQQLCAAERAIIVVAQSSAFDVSLSSRLHQLCGTHIETSNESVRARPVKNLNVSKVNNVDKGKSNGFFFNVEPDIGINIVPVSQVRV